MSPDAAPRSRRWSSLFIAAYLVAMVALPVSYYLRDDPFDERFAWRMFSSIRTMRCQVAVSERPRAGRARGVDPVRVVSAPWVKHLQRAQPVVAERFLRSRCAPDVAQVQMTRTCTTNDATTGPSSRWRYDCVTGELERGGAGAPR